MSAASVFVSDVSAEQSCFPPAGLCLSRHSYIIISQAGCGVLAIQISATLVKFAIVADGVVYCRA